MSPLATSRSQLYSQPPGILLAELKSPMGPLFYPSLYEGKTEAPSGEAPAKITRGVSGRTKGRTSLPALRGAFFQAPGWFWA